MEALFSSGHAADIVLVVLGVEALWLRTRGLGWGELASLLGPAALIVIGLRAALVSAPWYWVSLPLAAAFPLHLIDARRRLERQRRD